MKCKVKSTGCHGTYEKWTANVMLGGCCPNQECKVEKMMRNYEKSEAKKAKVERGATREKMEAAKTVQQLLNEAQVYCNRYIMLLDGDTPCISCGANSSTIQYCGGHYIARGSGANAALRFHRFNINRQCNKHCNQAKSGNVLEYRKGLIKKIGLDNVDYLENHPYQYRYTREDAIDIKLHYMSECRRLKQEME